MEIELPDGTVLDAPDDADASAVARVYMSKQQRPATAEPTLMESVAKNIPHNMDEAKSLALRNARFAARTAGLAGRTVLNAVTALPLSAMDAGVGIRNYIDEKRQPKQITPQPFRGYELPSQTWNNALDAYGLPKHEGLEKVGDVVGQMAVGGALAGPSQLGDLKSAAGILPGVKAAPLPQLAPANFNPATLKQQAFEKARAQGYVVPPSTIKPSATNKILEGAAGKTMMQQEASLKNQPITDALVKGDIGVNATDDVAEGTMSALRSEASLPYKALRSVGTMRADAQYGKALDTITVRYQGAAKDFPGLARDDIAKAVEAVRKPSFESDSAMDAIAILRDKSSTAYRQGDKPLGKAYREISGALEDAVERSLSRRGKDATQLLGEFRSARQLIAKTYSAEGALNTQTGSFNATKLATQLAKGKPLSGGMKKAAEFATGFPKAAQMVMDSGSVRNTDVALGAGTALLAHEPRALLYPFARQALRAAMLSPGGQQLLTQQSMQPMPKTALEILYGTHGLLSQ